MTKKQEKNREDLLQYLREISIRLQNSHAGILNDALKTVYHEYARIKYRNVLRRNTSFKNIYSENDRCFIVGNGPSLLKQDLSLLANEHVFVVNWFYQHELFHEISPEYYTVFGPAIFNITDPWFSKMLHQLDKALNKTRSKTKLFLPLNQIDFCVKNHLFKNVDVYYLLPSLDMYKYGIRKIDISGRLPSGVNATYLGMMLGYYMGFRKMILIGCDCSWAALPVTQEHFYSEDYRDHSSYEFLSCERVLEVSLELFKGYRILNNFLTSRGCKIYNATHGGFLDVFPRVEYEQLFK